MTQKHKNYEILNLLGYGLAKFDKDFIRQFGFESKTEFFDFLIKQGVSETVGTIKNRQSLSERR